eukprot:CAMPEP_0114262010 /NCGR_PEP_ID=MMETSP0058-20121206/21510_1 /TAXON_ID=36894 /ORGANISM="Pyramimonas parkeae, CCMP726" /LENGTH=118 /DNA_ID=CAMNT_0001377719 /DNA_START=338 /DNA_END=692 /DNA_ORIENTATION=-
MGDPSGWRRCVGPSGQVRSAAATHASWHTSPDPNRRSACLGWTIRDDLQYVHDEALCVVPSAGLANPLSSDPPKEGAGGAAATPDLLTGGGVLVQLEQEVVVRRGDVALEQLLHQARV